MLVASREQIQSYTGHGWWGQATISDLFDRSV
jgi:hypothetical protein